MISRWPEEKSRTSGRYNGVLRGIGFATKIMLFVYPCVGARAREWLSFLRSNAVRIRIGEQIPFGFG